MILKARYGTINDISHKEICILLFINNLTNNCPIGVATQRADLRQRLVVDEAAEWPNRFLRASVEVKVR